MAAITMFVFTCVLIAWMYFTKLNLRKRWLWSFSWTWLRRRLGFLWKEMSSVPICLSSAFCRILNIFKNMTDSPDSAQDFVAAPEMSPDVICNNSISSRTYGLVPSVDESDLKELMGHISDHSNEPPWWTVMEKSTPTLQYQAWCRDPPVGPTQYRTRTVFENVTPELIRDFFWDDDFRTKWDKMLVYFKTLQVCPDTGTMVVHWIRKLPIIFSEREYVIIRRLWESGSNYYCVTKGTSHPSLPNSKTRKRVKVYYSSWLIKPVKSRNNQQLPASEVVLFHYEDIGIPKEIVKMGARAGGWSFMKRMDAAVKAYSAARATGAAPSNYALLAQIATKFEPSVTVEDPCLDLEVSYERQDNGKKRERRRVLRWLVVGGIIVVSGVGLKSNGIGFLSETAKCLQRLCIRTRKQQDGGGERKELDHLVER